MKNYTTIVLLIAVLGIVVGGNVLYGSLNNTVQAAVEESSTGNSGSMKVEMATPGAMMEEGISKKSEYVLPYPGILQNHPLYFLKEFRDQIIEVLIADPLRKSEFYLLQSDKWIAASDLLIVQEQTDLAEKVLNKSADRMNDSIKALKSIKADGREVPSGVIDKVEKSIEKHLEMVDEFSIEKKINPDQARQTLLTAQEELNKVKN